MWAEKDVEWMLRLVEVLSEVRLLRTLVEWATR